MLLLVIPRLVVLQPEDVEIVPVVAEPGLEFPAENNLEILLADFLASLVNRARPLPGKMTPLRSH